MEAIETTRNYKEWTLEEVRRLHDLHNQGFAPDTIAEQLGRTPLSIRGMLTRSKLGLRGQFTEEQIHEIEMDVESLINKIARVTGRDNRAIALQIMRAVKQHTIPRTEVEDAAA